MTDYTSKAHEIQDELPDRIDEPVSDIEDSLEQLHKEYSVPMDEAKRTLLNNLQEEHDIGDDEMSSSSAQDMDVDIGDLTTDMDDEWMNIRGTVQEIIELSDAQSNWMAQRGVIGDDTGTTRFTIPDEAVEENDDLLVEEGETVEYNGVVGNAYNGELNVRAVNTTDVSRIDASFDPPEHDTKLSGCIIGLQKNSGYIRRCPEDDCTRVVTSGDGGDKCQEHGSVDGNGEPDLRLKALLDNGEDTHQVYFDQENTEAITGMSLEEAEKDAKDAVDTAAPAREMERILVGRHYKINGNQLGEYVLVDEFKQLTRDWDAAAQNIIDTLDDIDTEVQA